MTFPYKGYAGKYLDIDLTKGVVHKRNMEKEAHRDEYRFESEEETPASTCWRSSA